MIIHVTGPSGSGKSMIGLALKKYKHLMVIELDDVDDNNALKIFKDKKNDKLFTNNGSNEFDKLKSTMNTDDIKQLIENAIKQNKIPVFIGLTINPPKVTNGFSIDIDFDTLYRQRCKRGVVDICKNSLATTIKEKNVNKMFEMFRYKHKIRIPYPPFPPVTHDDIKRHRSFAKKKKYTIMKSTQIINEIVKLSS